MSKYKIDDLNQIIPENDVYKSFNNFIFSNDVRVIGKLLQRYKFFEKIKDMPGDIVELGVFKGSGVATWSKFLELNCTYSNKRVIGFDLFNANNNTIDNYDNGDKMKSVYNRVKSDELSLNSVENNLNNMQLSFKKHILVEGDIVQTTQAFVKENPGLRIALLYIDVDLCEPTYHGLKNLWNHILPGGYIVFDEYEFHKFDESSGVDKFLKEFNIPYEIKSTNSLGPTAYMIKKTA
jgi:hypothetical protein